MRTLIFAVPTLLVVAGCQPDQHGGAGLATLTRDSAGIRIIENAKPTEGSRVWQVGPEPALTIGVREGEDHDMLHRVRDATKLSDGRIVIANRGDDELRVFDASGNWLESWGGRGEGPGEFSGLDHVDTWPGDSIIAWSGPGSSILVFDSDGNFGRGFKLETNEDDPMGFYVFPTAVTAAGSILAGQIPSIFDRVRVEIRDAEGRLQSSLGEHPGIETHRVESVRGSARMITMYEVIFGPTVGQVPWGDLIVHSLNDRYEIRAFAEDGTLARIVRRDHAARPPTAEEVEGYIEEQVSGYPDDIAAEQRGRYESVPVAENMPAFTSVMVDGRNHLWVEEYELPGEERPGSLWTVFDAQGRVQGFVETPDGLEIFEIGEDYILGLWRDELEVEYVQVWELER
ncbi:MAG: 6-bladed beta-propeller [Gemmatimonadota bacterium]|nr:6-bladed beta-propeller [Gemmatimonadota bacterium]